MKIDSECVPYCYSQSLLWNKYVNRWLPSYFRLPMITWLMFPWRLTNYNILLVYENVLVVWHPAVYPCHSFISQVVKWCILQQWLTLTYGTHEARHLKFGTDLPLQVVTNWWCSTLRGHDEVMWPIFYTFGPLSTFGRVKTGLFKFCHLYSHNMGVSSCYLKLLLYLFFT